MANWDKIVARHPNVFTFDIAYKRQKGWSMDVLLCSDTHWDSKHCDRSLMRKHFDEAKEKGAKIFILGDFFDCMGGKYDPRSHKGSIREEFKVANYFDVLCEEAAEWLHPYHENLGFISKGNHEITVLQRQEVDLIQRTCSILNYRNPGSDPVFSAPYTGWLLFDFHDNGASKRSVKLAYTHGSGGGGPVTRGVIQTNRRAVYLPDADIVASGHIHESWVVEIPRERLASATLKPGQDIQTHICLGTYKSDYHSPDSWHRRTGKPPKPTGSWWLRFYWSSKHEKVLYSFIRTEQ